MIKQLTLSLCLATISLAATAADYTTYLTAERGFTEVTSTEGIVASPDYYYILCSAENTGLIVGVGTYEAKPGWASEQSKALRYISADTDPVLNKSNFFNIEKSGDYIGLRNVVYSSDLFQTHDNAGFMYVNTYTDKNLDEWSYLTHTYQNGYWIFESGKYPMSSGNWACGYLGPWNKTVAAGEPMALNRQNTTGDEAGHYRLFRIAKNDFLTEWGKLWQTASASNKIDATWMITNPSFETGDWRGWTFEARGDNNNLITEYNDVVVSNSYGMSNKDGSFLFNAYQWWATSMNISQTVTNLPSGEYELSAVVATWENRTVTFIGNGNTITKTGQGDQTGIPVSLNVTIGNDQKLTISTGSTGQWWVTGHEGETQTFFKLDNVQLKCKGLYLNAVALPLPNDDTTLLQPGFWYYYDIPFGTEYQLIGNIDGMVYTTDGNKLISNITTSDVTRQMTFSKGRVYFKTTNEDATLKVVAKREINESTNSFKACALNVDGLPESITILIVPVTLNPDGPQSDGTKKISTYLSNKGYDLMAFSEDFNFHTELTSNISGYHWGTHQGKISVTSRDTDGLEFACKNGSVTWANETITRYTSKSNTDGNQYIEKGFRHYDVTFDGQLIDVYITHMDAGSNDDAITSRGKQWKQLTEAINAVDNGRETPRPKIILGDTNCRWTRDAVKANFFDLLNNNLKASDVWVEFYRNGIYPTTDMNDLTDQSNPTNYTNYEIVDKIIYINPTAPNTPQLVPQSFTIEQDYTYEDGTTPLGDHKPVVVEFKIVTSGEPLPAEIELPDEGVNNATIIANAQGALANVTLSGRTLYKDGYWNTLCLPFNMTEEQVTAQLAPATEGMKTLTSTNYEESTHTLYLNFEDATKVQAGVPFIVKWEAGADWENPVFSNVTIDNSLTATETTYADFIGNYAPISLEANGTTLYLGSDNTLYYPTTSIPFGACRAYFQLKGDIFAGESAPAVNSFALNFDGETNGIKNVQSPMDNGQWYTIDGVKLQGKPTTRGLYINGKNKVLIK
ncbi:MAG: hypothetical protein IKG99_10310 [Bacteroidaceae bacterium]|nr:hypothetical protein [Bacteroidaceae bacterium]